MSVHIPNFLELTIEDCYSGMEYAFRDIFIEIREFLPFEMYGDPYTEDYEHEYYEAFYYEKDRDGRLILCVELGIDLYGYPIETLDFESRDTFRDVISGILKAYAG